MIDRRRPTDHLLAQEHLAKVRQWARAWRADNPGRCRLPKHPYGKTPCRVCGGKLEGRRTSYCSNECSDFRYYRTSWFRDIVWEWSDGHCAMCGVDIRDLAREYAEKHEPWRERVTMRVVRRCFDADHILPLWDGGDPGPANGWVLCKSCHKQKTKIEAGRRARRKRSYRES